MARLLEASICLRQAGQQCQPQRRRYAGLVTALGFYGLGIRLRSELSNAGKPKEEVMSEVVKKKDVDKLVAGIRKNLEKAQAALEALNEVLDTELEVVSEE